MTKHTEWTDAEKAQWILENQWTDRDINYIYERVGNTVYRRPMREQEALPPWISTKREVCMEIQDPRVTAIVGTDFIVTDTHKHYQRHFGKITDK